MSWVRGTEDVPGLRQIFDRWMAHFVAAVFSGGITLVVIALSLSVYALKTSDPGWRGVGAAVVFYFLVPFCIRWLLFGAAMIALVSRHFVLSFSLGILVTVAIAVGRIWYFVSL